MAGSDRNGWRHQIGTGGGISSESANAAAKVIEGIFGILEQRYFKTIPGWAGGDRTNKKTAKVGKPTEPFGGTLDDLRRAIGACLTLYEIQPQRGDLNNLSPRQVYEAALARGWQRVAVNSRQLDSVFSVSEFRTVIDGKINFDGKQWTCRELQSFMGKRIEIRAPKFVDFHELPLMLPNGSVLGFAVPETSYGYLDSEGARESNLRARAHLNGVKSLAAIAPNIDPTVEIAHLAASHSLAPPAPVAGTISINSQIADGMSEPPALRAERLELTSQREARERNEEITRLFQQIRSAG